MGVVFEMWISPQKIELCKMLPSYACLSYSISESGCLGNHCRGGMSGSWDWGGIGCCSWGWGGTDCCNDVAEVVPVVVVGLGWQLL